MSGNIWARSKRKTKKLATRMAVAAVPRFQGAEFHSITISGRPTHSTQSMPNPASRWLAQKFPDRVEVKDGGRPRTGGRYRICTDKALEIAGATTEEPK
jgi:hypothetical protein